MCKTKLTTRLSSWKEEEMTTSLDRESRSKEVTIMEVIQEKDDIKEEFFVGHQEWWD